VSYGRAEQPQPSVRLYVPVSAVSDAWSYVTYWVSTISPHAVTDAPTAVGVAYLDSSALVKLVVVEPESAALREAIKAFGPKVRDFS
jgi:hypothetical protein